MEHPAVKRLIEKQDADKSNKHTINPYQLKQAHLETDRMKTHFKAAKDFLVST